MTDAFAGRLRALTDLDATAIAELIGLAAPDRPVERERSILCEGERPSRLHVLQDGWAARVKMLPDGRRHLAGLLMPGDVCDIDGLHLRTYDYGVVALSACRVATIERAAIVALGTRRPRVAQVLAWLGFVDNAVLNESAASLALRSARERLAHLFCELNARLAVVGRTRANGFDLPLTQAMLGEALGLTPVHVNRTLGAMRTDGAATFAAWRVSVADWRRLAQEASFSPAYLHLDGIRPVAAAA